MRKGVAAMTPAEVIAMRDNLAQFVGSIPPRQEDIELADDLIKTGWVVAPPNATLTASMNHATLPNCDGCGRFTSNPDVKRWCEGRGDWHACHERLLCPKCAEKENNND